MEPREFYDKTAGIYDLRHSSPATKLVRKKEEFLVRRFASGRVLDFGCGTGHHIQDGLIGLDISSKMLKMARVKSKFLIQANESLPIRSGSIDTIYCFFTVLNMVDSEKLAQEFFRVLKPGGRILLSVASIHDNHGKSHKSYRVSGSRLNLRLYKKTEIENLFRDFSLEHFSSLFSITKPQFGKFRINQIDRFALLLDSLFTKVEGGMYLFVFKK